MNIKKTLGIFVTMAAVAVIPQASFAEGDMRSLLPADPNDQFGLVERGSGSDWHLEYTKDVKAYETLRFRVRLLNRHDDETFDGIDAATGQYTNTFPWALQHVGSGNILLETNMLPKVAIRIGNRTEYATLESYGPAASLSNPLDVETPAYFTDVVFAYQIKPGDMGLPISVVSTTQGNILPNNNLAMNTDKWQFKNSRGETAVFAFGIPQADLRTSTTNPGYVHWCASEDSDPEVTGTLREANIRVLAVDFEDSWADRDADVWREINEGSTTASPAQPGVTITDAHDTHSYYVWTEDEGIAIVDGGTPVTQTTNGITYTKHVGTVIVSASSTDATGTFRIKGLSRNKTTRVFLSTSMTNELTATGETYVNYLERTVKILEPEAAKITLTIDGATFKDVEAGTNFTAYVAQINVSLTQPFSNAFDIVVNPVMVDGASTADPWTFINLSALSSNGQLASDRKNTITVPANVTSVTAGLYIYALGANADTYGVGSKGIYMEPTIASANADAIDFFVTNGSGLEHSRLTVKPCTPAITSIKPMSPVAVNAGVAQTFKVTVADSYNNMVDGTLYTVHWAHGDSMHTTTSPEDRSVAVTNGVLELDITYDEAGTFDTYVWVDNISGETSENDKYPLSVTAAPPRTITSEFVDHNDNRYYGEGDPARIKILLSQGLGASTVAYAYLVPLDEASSNYVAFANERGLTEGIKVAKNMTEASSYVELNLLDGCSDTALLSYELQLWSGAKWESRGTQYASYISDDLMLTVTNKIPSIGSVFVSGAGLVEENGGELKAKVAKNVDKVFSIRSVNDVQADLTNNLEVTWTFISPSGQYKELTPVKGSLEELVVTNKFSLNGSWTAQAKLKDKDGGIGPVFSFRFEVLATPEVQIKFPASNIYNESDVADGGAFFYVDLSAAADEDLTVAVKKTRKGADGIMDIGDDDSGMLYVDIPAGETRKTVQIAEFDGTSASADLSTGGFSLEAYVTNGVENADGVAYSNVYQKASEQIFVVNSRPRLDQAYIPGTNHLSALKGVDVSIPYLVSDVMADLTNGITLTWTTSEGAVTTTNAYQGTFKTRFTEGGEQYVTLAIVDKDGGRSMQEYKWLFIVSPIKNVLVKPLGPHRKGYSDYAQSYLDLSGSGQGRVWTAAPNGLDSLAVVSNFVQHWNFSPKSEQATVYARGYKVGNVDNGALPGGLDVSLDPAGGHPAGDYTGSFYPYSPKRDGMDSFFYCWILSTKDEQGNYTATRLGSIAPETDLSDNGEQIVGLPPFEEEAVSYDSRVVEAVFSLEKYASDNLGDINQDGVPDVYAVKGWDVGYLYALSAAEGSSESLPPDRADVSEYNDDLDYLPAASARGNAGILPSIKTWATVGAPFSADLELRGYHLGLNYRKGDDSASQNINVRGAYVSDPLFSEAESNRFAEVSGVPIPSSDDATVRPTEEAAWDAAVRASDWSPENRTDPTKYDTDGDGFPDGYEYWFWYMAEVGWMNDDGSWERLKGSRFTLDDIATGEEITSDDIAFAFNPTVKSTDKFEERDTDNDGLTDYEELVMGTNPLNWDSDGDGMSDYWEILRGLNPLKADDANGAGMNADGDFMARHETEKNYTIVKIGDNEYALPDFGVGLLADDFSTLKAELTSFDAIPVFRYGKPGSVCVPRYRCGTYNILGVERKPLDTESITIDPATNGTVATVVSMTNTLVLVHDQVYTQFGFDPRTGWSDISGYVSPRWKPGDSNSGVGNSGAAVDTAKFTALDEYLLLKYRYETTPAPSKVNPHDKGDKTYSLVGDKARWADRKFAEVFLLGTTNPNVPFEDPDWVSKNMQTADWRNPDAVEWTFSCDDHGADTDGDGAPDGWELYVRHNPNTADNSDTKDLDNDKLTLAEEYAGTDSCNVYSNAVTAAGTATIYANHPGLKSGWYNKFFPTDPWDYDTDGDSLGDNVEGAEWKGRLVYGKAGHDGDANSSVYTYSFIYGPNENKPAEDDGSVCIRGGGLNPCAVDTDGDRLPDPWEREFAGYIFKPDGTPLAATLAGNSDVVTLIRRGDGLADGAVANTEDIWYISGGMDGTFGRRYNGSTWTGDAFANPSFSDPATRTVRDFDFDHDGLQNFQEYLVQSLRHLRFDDASTPLMGQWMPGGAPSSLKFVQFLPMDIMDGETFYAAAKAAGFTATGAWKFDELGYFARPPHEWDPAACCTAAMDSYAMMSGYRVMLPPCLRIREVVDGNPAFVSYWAQGYCGTDPRQWDTDNDGMDDYYEIFHGLNPLLGSVTTEGGIDVIGNACSSFKSKGAYWVWGGGMTSPHATWWRNAWTGWPLLPPSQPTYDAMKYPWVIGAPECDADGDGTLNEEEALLVNLASPSPSHTDPTPLWMTDTTTPAKSSFTAQYYQLPMSLYEWGDVWGWNVSLSGYLTSAGQSFDWMFAFEENEGYDTDHDGLPDNEERASTATAVSDPLDFSDPDRRQALYFQGSAKPSAAVSRSSTFSRTIYMEAEFLRQFTVEAWIRPADVSREQVILERVCWYGADTLSNNVGKVRANFRLGLMPDGRLFGQFDTPDAVETGSGNGTPTVTGPVPELNVWTHVAFSFDGSMQRLYVNGAQVAETPTTLPPANGLLQVMQEALPGNAAFPVLLNGYRTVPAAFVMGTKTLDYTGVELSDYTMWGTSYDAGRCYSGYIDEVRVWDGVRTEAEIFNARDRRLTSADAKAMREEVYAAWRGNSTTMPATRNDNDGRPMLPAELVMHYNFQTLPGAVEEADVLSEPFGFSKHVLDNVRDVDMLPVAGDLVVGWWDALASGIGNRVYTDRHWVPWIPNTCAHLPPFDGSAVDSQYWSANFGGVCYATEEGVEAFTFPNTMNPYPCYNFISDRGYHAIKLQNLAKIDSAEWLADLRDRYVFELRSAFAGSSDLIPLGYAYAKRATDMWDGDGVADAWTVTRDDFDDNGIPDWWQTVAQTYYGYNPASGILKWDTLVARDGIAMTAREAYIRDLASGMLPGGIMADAAGNTYETNADRDHDGLPDWWETLNGVASETGRDDHDGDGLSNHAEYLIGEGFSKLGFPRISPTMSRTFVTDGQTTPDYFLTFGSLYLGEMFTDFDMMEDQWEDQFEAMYVSRATYDANADIDADGWSNFAECRAATDPAKVVHLGVDETVLKDFPVPTVRAKIAYLGNAAIAPIVVQAWRADSLEGRPDAVWTITTEGASSSGGSSTNATGTSERQIGVNPQVGYTMALGPGEVVPGTVQVLFKDITPYLVSATRRWLSDASGVTSNFTDVVYSRTQGGSADAEWVIGVKDRVRDGNHEIGDLVAVSIDSVLGTVGTINYITGEMTVDFSQLVGEWIYDRNTTDNYWVTWKTSTLSKAYVKVTWSSLLPQQGFPITVNLTDPDDTSVSPSLGRLREGKNTFVFFIDSDANGTYTPGEPYGVAMDVDVGWSRTSFDVELTDTAPQMARYQLSATTGTSEASSSSSSSSDATATAITDRSENGYYYENVVVSNGLVVVPPASRTRVRIVRTAINGVASEAANGVVYDKVMDLTVRPTLTEFDVMATTGNPDLDWGTLANAFSASGSGLIGALSNVTYRVVLGDGTISWNVVNNMIPEMFVNSFENKARYQTATMPETNQMVYAGSPTFRWRHDPLDMNGIRVKDYPAFELRIYAADGNTVIYDSGVQRAPIRDSNGFYSWTAPVYCGMVTPQGYVFEAKNNYYWSVSMLDAKFTSFSPGESKTPFRLVCTGDLTDGNGYGSIDVAVKYFGPLLAHISANPAQQANLIRVQAFNSADFTGSPVGEAYVTDASQLYASNAVPVNAVIRGVPPGTYYVRAFIDTSSDGRKDAWETWGYGNYVGDAGAKYVKVARGGLSGDYTAESFRYTPKPVTVAEGVAVPKATIYMEDVDTDNDGFPDAWEMLAHGSLAALGTASGDTYYVKVNPNLQSTLSAYTQLNGTPSFPVFTLMSAASSGSLSDVAMMLGSERSAMKDETFAMIDSFSLTDGLAVSVSREVSTGTPLFVADGSVTMGVWLLASDSLDFANAVKVYVTDITVEVNGPSASAKVSPDTIRKVIDDNGLGGSSFFKVELIQK